MANSLVAKLSRLAGRFGPLDDLSSPLWSLRLIPVLVLIALGLSQTVLKHTAFEGPLIGFAIGQLIVLSLVGFSIQDLTCKHRRDPAEPQQLHLHR